MAIGPHHIEWMSHLALRAGLGPRTAVLDLGPQDVQIDRESLLRIARRHLPVERAEQIMQAIYAGEAAPRPDCQLDFYSIFGAETYRSVDMCDPRATYAADLNLPVPNLGRYDLVTNFGTTEHVFNIGGTFASIHRLLKVGGVQVHAVPIFAYVDHGYYNLHPSAYLDMARTNNYEVVDFTYVDNIVVRDRTHTVQAEPPDFAAFPIQVRQMKDTADLMTKIAARYYRNLSTPETIAVLGAMLPPDQRDDLGEFPDPRLPLAFVFDLALVALRRTAASPEAFVPPSQMVFGRPRRTVRLRQMVAQLRARVGV